MSSEGSYGCGSPRAGPSVSLSPSDDLFFKGRLLPLEPSLVFAISEPNSKPHFPSSLLKSATKLRVFMFRFKKPKSTTGETNGTNVVAAAASPREDVVLPAAAAGSEEKSFTKDVVQRYLNKIKPFYVRVSKRYGEKLLFSGQLAPAEANGGEKEHPAVPPSAGPFKSQKLQAGNLPAGLRVVCKRLKKSRSASSAVASVRSPPPALPRRRDDSLLQQEDGIQSAIAHCKRSFNVETGFAASESPLIRSWSDPGGERSEEGKFVVGV